MENLQLKAIVSSHATGKTTAANEVAATDADPCMETGFQGLLQLAMGQQAPTDTPATATAETDASAADKGDDLALVMPFSLIDATPPSVIPSPITVPSPTQALAANGICKLPDAITDAAQPLSPRLTADATSDVTAGTQSPSLDPRTKTETAVPEKNLSRFLEQVMGSQPGHAGNSYREHALEALAQHRDATAANMPLPQFTQGLHPLEPAHAFPATHARMETPVGAPGWTTEFAQKVVWMAGDKQHMAELHVNPPDLGALSIKLSVSDSQTNAIFTSPHSEVRDAIESALPRLREVLAESGITLGNASVTADSPRDGSAFDQPRQPRPFLADKSGADTAADPSATHTVVHSRGNGLVDLFA